MGISIDTERMDESIKLIENVLKDLQEFDDIVKGYISKINPQAVVNQLNNLIMDVLPDEIEEKISSIVQNDGDGDTIVTLENFSTVISGVYTSINSLLKVIKSTISDFEQSEYNNNQIVNMLEDALGTISPLIQDSLNLGQDNVEIENKIEIDHTTIEKCVDIMAKEIIKLFPESIQVLFSTKQVYGLVTAISELLLSIIVELLPLKLGNIITPENVETILIKTVELIPGKLIDIMPQKILVMLPEEFGEIAELEFKNMLTEDGINTIIENVIKLLPEEVSVYITDKIMPIIPVNIGKLLSIDNFAIFATQLVTLLPENISDIIPETVEELLAINIGDLLVPEIATELISKLSAILTSEELKVVLNGIVSNIAPEIVALLPAEIIELLPNIEIKNDYIQVGSIQLFNKVIEAIKGCITIENFEKVILELTSIDPGELVSLINIKDLETLRLAIEDILPGEITSLITTENLEAIKLALDTILPDQIASLITIENLEKVELAINSILPKELLSLINVETIQLVVEKVLLELPPELLMQLTPESVGQFLTGVILDAFTQENIALLQQELVGVVTNKLPEALSDALSQEILIGILEQTYPEISTMLEQAVITLFSQDIIESFPQAFSEKMSALKIEDLLNSATIKTIISEIQGFQIPQATKDILFTTLSQVINIDNFIDK